jgi:hypothetical protein
VLAEGDATETLRDLFGHRGFDVIDLAFPGAIEREVVHTDLAPAGAVIDFRRADAARACAALRSYCPATVVVAVVLDEQVAQIQDDVDAVFCPPVDRARLFVRVVELIAARRHGGEHSITRITGVVGVIRGNGLFHRVLAVLHQVVPPVNAGAILERALREIDAQPESIDEPDLAAILASGRLFDALAPFVDSVSLQGTLATLSGLLNVPESPEDPCIPVRTDVEITARTCG